MPKTIKKYYEDILEAIHHIEEISLQKKLINFEKITIKWSVERGIAIIGEAL